MRPKTTVPVPANRAGGVSPPEKPKARMPAARAASTPKRLMLFPVTWARLGARATRFRVTDPNHAAQPDRRARSHVGRPLFALVLPAPIKRKNRYLFYPTRVKVFTDRPSWDSTSGFSLCLRRKSRPHGKIKRPNFCSYRTQASMSQQARPPFCKRSHSF